MFIVLPFSFMLQVLIVLLFVVILSTFGGNPLASAVAIASLDVIRDERLAERYHICYLDNLNNFWKMNNRFFMKCLLIANLNYLKI